MVFDIEGESYIYRFWDANEIIYVGQTKNIYQRFSTHNHLNDECYKSICYIDYSICSDTEISDYEKYYIQKLNPKYNHVKYQNEKISKLPELNFRPFKETIGSLINWSKQSSK